MAASLQDLLLGPDVMQYFQLLADFGRQDIGAVLAKWFNQLTARTNGRVDPSRQHPC